MSESERWLAEVTKELAEEFTPQGYPVTTNEVGYCLMKFASYFNAEATMDPDDPALTRPPPS